MLWSGVLLSVKSGALDPGVRIGDVPLLAFGLALVLEVSAPSVRDGELDFKGSTTYQV